MNGTILLAGDSHVQTALNDTLIKSTINISQAGEQYIFTYFKLLKLLDHNIKIHSIYLGFANHNISSYRDHDDLGEFDISAYYFCILPCEEKARFIQHHYKMLIPYIKEILKSGFQNATNKNKPPFFLGHSLNINETITPTKISIEQRVLSQYYIGNKLCSISSSQLMYLDKIVELCQSKSIKLIMLNTPIHPSYKSKIPIVFQNKYQDILDKYNLQKVDLSNLVKNDNLFLPDGDHLNAKGATVFSTYFNDSIAGKLSAGFLKVN
ncbi:MAG: hypothetical protein V4717_00710 [Bacteroidota bacterium]